MLSAFILTMTTLLSNYEQKENFRLTRYFVSLALILGVPMAFILGEAIAQLTEREDLRWSLVAFFSTALFLLIGALLGVVNRGQQVLDERTIAIEQEKQWRTDMTNLIAHDLKNPLNATFLELHMVEKRLASSTTEDLPTRLKRIGRNAKSMSLLIDNMLDVERLEAGILLVNRNVLNLDALIENSVTDAQNAAELYKVTLFRVANIARR